MSRRITIAPSFTLQLTHSRPASSSLRPLWQTVRFSSSSSSSSASSAMQHPRFSSNTDAATYAPKVEALLESSGGRWTLASDGQALERSFKFKTFAKTWDFMTAVSLQCKIKNHHPEWSNVYNTTFIRWTTHEPKGLSDKDVSLATLCDALARDFGELQPEPASGTAKSLADKAASSAGGCCR